MCTFDNRNLSRRIIISVMLAVLCVGSSPAWAQDEDSVPGVEVGAEAPELERELIPSVDGSASDAGRAQPPSKPRWNPRQSKNTPKFLGLVALLLLWLLARTEARRQASSVPQRPSRHAPISPDELGHAAFLAALDADLEEYRGLFLNGPEAAQVLGTDAAEAYLSRRSLRALEDALAEFAARIPAGAHFDHAAMEGEDLCLVTLRLDDDSKATLPLGSVSRVGRVLRLREPAVVGRFGL